MEREAGKQILSLYIVSHSDFLLWLPKWMNLNRTQKAEESTDNYLRASLPPSRTAKADKKAVGLQGVIQV